LRLKNSFGRYNASLWNISAASTRPVHQQVELPAVTSDQTLNERRIPVRSKEGHFRDVRYRTTLHREDDCDRIVHNCSLSKNAWL
jgi:hypothetical protein